jgi:predicted  nucleic acid-binding Zn-ribbon protein
MDKNEDGRFVFGADDKTEPVAYGDGTRSRLDSLSLKVTLIAIIMPCLIGIVMVFGYLDMNRRVSLFKDTGSQEVRSASKDMERMVSSLQVKNARMEKLLAEELGKLKTRLATLETKISKARKDVDFITSTRITKKQANASLGTLRTRLNKNDEALALIQSDDAETIDRTRALEKKAAADAKDLAQLKADLAAAQKEVSTLSRAIPSVQEINARLKKERILTQVRIEEVRTSLGKRIDTMAKESKSTAAPDPIAPPTPKSGPITEQNIGS